MRGVCRLCGLMLSAPTPPAAPLDAAGRARVELLLDGGLAFAHMMQDHCDQAASLVSVMVQLQSLIGLSFFEPIDDSMTCAHQAGVASLRSELGGWLSNPDGIKVSRVMPGDPQ